MSKRVHDLAKQLGMDNKELIALLKDRGYVVKSASSTVDNISAEALIEEFAKPVAPVAVEPVEEPKAPSAPPSGFVKTTEDLDNERREREAAAAAAKAASAPQSPVGMTTPVVSSGLAAPKLPAPLPRLVAGAAPKTPLPPTTAAPTVRYPSMGAPTIPRPPQPAGGSGHAVIAPPKAKFVPSAKIPPSLSRPSAPASVASAPKAPSTPPSVKGPSASPPPPRPTTAETAASAEPGPDGGKVVQVKPPIIVRDFANLIGVKPFRLISELMEMGIFASMNQAVDEEVAMRLGRRHGFTLEIKHRGEQVAQPEKKPEPPAEDDPKNLEPRPPIVCVLGHVNHGKTTLLDAIRKTSVAAGEAGGITQHTGAYQIEHNNHKITFLDTPGHAAFSKMRERGASLTDIAVLVVAADDGFMPQTEEALKFAQRANVPLVVAINKMDAKGANIDRVKQAMQQHGITSEDWGGETLCEQVSALKGQNIDKLLDALLLQAEIMDLKANPKAPAEGVVVDSQVEIGRGATATIIVLKGTLKPGAALVCGQHYCKVRAMVDDHDEPLKAAPPGTPVRILGWSGAPDAGARFRVVKHDREAKAEAEAAAREARIESNTVGTPTRVADLSALLQAIHQTKQKTFRCILKGDVHGTVEALEASLLDIKSEKVKLEIVAADVGPIGQNDVAMAAAAEAAVVGFNVRMENGVQSQAKNKNVRIIQHDIIYELINQVREAMAELLDPELRENKLGAAEVRQVFPVAKGFVAGCMVTEGRITRAGHARVLRKGAPVFTGRIGTLKRFKDDASEVRAGFECGIRLDNFDGYEPGDVIECFEISEIKSTL